MKKISTLFLLMLGFSLGICAQIPNGDFESWAGNSLNGWYTNNDAAALNGNVAASPETPAPEGNTYLKLTSYFDVSQGMVTGGIAICGTVEFLPTAVNIFGFPYTLRPDFVTGVYQYQATTDFGYGICYFTKWNTSTNSRDTVGTGNVVFSPASEWTNFNIPMTYSLADFPDSCVVGFVSSTVYPSEMGASLSLDNLQFSSTPASTSEIQKSQEWALYPNPAKEVLNINLPTDVTYPVLAVITDETGRVIKQETFYTAIQSHIQVNDLKRGMYVIQLKSNDRRFVKSFIKN